MLTIDYIIAQVLSAQGIFHIKYQNKQKKCDLFDFNYSMNVGERWTGLSVSGTGNGIPNSL